MRKERARRYLPILDQKEELLDAPGKPKLPPFQGRIELENVSFSYDSDSAPVLKDISLAARKGEVIALVGSSGAGKTTLVNLIPRFYEPTTGTIRIDGHRRA